MPGGQRTRPAITSTCRPYGETNTGQPMSDFPPAGFAGNTPAVPLKGLEPIRPGRSIPLLQQQAGQIRDADAPDGSTVTAAKRSITSTAIKRKTQAVGPNVSRRPSRDIADRQISTRATVGPDIALATVAIDEQLLTSGVTSSQQINLFLRADSELRRQSRIVHEIT